MRRRWLRLGCLSFVLLVPLAVCGISAYTERYASAVVVLNRLAGDATQRLSLKEVQAALLHHLPPGTTRPTVIAYLEAHDIMRDRFEGGQWLRYQDQGRVILGLISDPPWQFTLFCNGTTYYVRFYFDDANRLHDIFVENQMVCL